MKQFIKINDNGSVDDIFSLSDIFNKKFEIKGFLIYRIINIVTKKSYVGQTRHSLIGRFYGHYKEFIKNNNIHLYNSMNKYGIENFKVEILAVCDYESQLDFWEEVFIMIHDSYYNGYNRSLNGQGFYKFDKKTLSENSKKYWNDPLYRQKNLESRKKYLSIPENREKVSKVARANAKIMNEKVWSDPEHRNKISLLMKNRIISEETINKSNKNPMAIYSRKLGKINNVLLKLSNLNLELSEENFNNYKPITTNNYKISIENYPQLFPLDLVQKHKLEKEIIENQIKQEYEYEKLLVIKTIKYIESLGLVLNKSNYNRLKFSNSKYGIAKIKYPYLFENIK